MVIIRREVCENTMPNRLFDRGFCASPISQILLEERKVAVASSAKISLYFSMLRYRDLFCTTASQPLITPVQLRGPIELNWRPHVTITYINLSQIPRSAKVEHLLLYR